MMQYKGYVGRVEYDDEAKVLHGEVLGIRDVVTFQAEAATDVEKEFRASVDDYLAFCKARGENPDKPMSGQFLARVGPALHKKLSTIAAASGRSLNAVVTEILEDGAEAAITGADVLSAHDVLGVTRTGDGTWVKGEPRGSRMVYGVKLKGAGGAGRRIGGGKSTRVSAKK